MGDQNRRVSRRRVLKGLGTAAVAGLAGCAAPADTADAPAQSGAGDGSDGEAELPNHPLTAPPQVVDLGAQGHESTLRVKPMRHQLVAEQSQGGPVELPEVWAFQADDRQPSVPGPVYRTREGNTIKLHFENTHNRPHTVHVHALGKDWKDDGVPQTTGVTVAPGESHTYTLKADNPGTHLYHCHVQTHNHLDMGMYGIIRVDPADYDRPDREYFLTLKEWDEDLHRSMAGGDADYDPAARNPRHYSVNGRAAPTTYHPELGNPIIGSAGERVRVHVVNAGYRSHAFHTHAHQFQVVREDGGHVPEAARHPEDVVDLAPAERKTLEFEFDADPGLYPVHCHKVDHVTNDGTYPGGMATAIVYEEAMDTEQFQSVMDKAGYDG